jgi:hypothetical protein
MKIIIVGIENIKPILSKLWLDIFINLFSKDYELLLLSKNLSSEKQIYKKFKLINKIEDNSGIIFSFWNNPEIDHGNNKIFYYVDDNILRNNKHNFSKLKIFSDYHLEELVEYFDNVELNEIKNRFFTFILPTEPYIQNSDITNSRNGACLLNDSSISKLHPSYKIIKEYYDFEIIDLIKFETIEELFSQIANFRHVCVSKIDFSILIHVICFCKKLGIKFSYHNDLKFESAKRFITNGCFNYFTKFLETSHFSLRKHILDLLHNNSVETHDHESCMIDKPCVIFYGDDSMDCLISLENIYSLNNLKLIDHTSIKNSKHRDLINLYLRVFHASAEYDQFQSLELNNQIFSTSNLNSNNLLYLLKNLNEKSKNFLHINRYYKNLSYLLSEQNDLDLAEVVYKSNLKINYFYYNFVSRYLLKDYFYYKIFFSNLFDKNILQIKCYLALLEKELADNRSDRFKVSNQNMATFLIILLKIAASDFEGLVSELKRNNTFTWTHYCTFSFILHAHGQKDLSLQVFKLIDMDSFSLEKASDSYHVMMLFTCDIIHQTRYFDSSIKNIDYNLYLDHSFKESLNYLPLNSFCFSVILAHFSKKQDFHDDYINSNPPLTPMYNRINEYLSFDSSKTNS